MPEENWLPIDRKDENIDAIMRIYVPNMKQLEAWDAPTSQRVGSE